MNIAHLVIYVSIYLGLVATTFYILSYKSDKSKSKPLFTDKELPFLSVIIPAYNEEKSIARTIETILDSKYPQDRFEVIVVDDGSKDKTYKIAKKYASKKVKVLTKVNGGKSSALNYGIKRSKGEIFISMDADTFVDPDSAIEMVRYFKNPEVMSVTPSMMIYKPKGILQRIQQAEYLFGLFIRKAFSSINAIHVTPGAFSAYRRSFVDKYGGYDEKTISEDLELALRIQYNGYYIEYSPESRAYTIGPKTFKSLLIQRRRWYTGLMKNTWRYKGIISNKYGDMGMFVIPIAWISIFFSVFIINYMVIKGIFDAKDEILFLQSINFDLSNVYNLNLQVVERFFYGIFTNNILVFFSLFLIVLGGYMRYATKKTGKVKGIYGTIAIYFLCFALLFGFWWTVSIFYVLFNKKVTWR